MIQSLLPARAAVNLRFGTEKSLKLNILELYQCQKYENVVINILCSQSFCFSGVTH